MHRRTENLSRKTGDKLSEKDRRKVAEFIEQRAGIQCPATKHTLIESRLRKRQRSLGFSTLAEYIHYTIELPQGKDEQINLIDCITTNKTDFYREEEHFIYLRKYLSELILDGAHQDMRPFSFWSAGCSSGEEPFTLAMELMELKREFKDLRFKILATDISLSCLKTAKTAIYKHERIEPLSLPLRQRYLLRSRDGKKQLVKIAPEVRQNVHFSTFNLLTDDYANQGKFDVIFCRNVMIYFSNYDRSAIAARFSRCLHPGGLLILGHSESLVGNHDLFSRVRPTVYQRCNALQ